nr:hypothetical protein [Prevotella sp.]
MRSFHSNTLTKLFLGQVLFYIGNDIVSTCTISFNTDGTLTCIKGLILATTGKNKQ